MGLNLLPCAPAYKPACSVTNYLLQKVSQFLFISLHFNWFNHIIAKNSISSKIHISLTLIVSLTVMVGTLFCMQLKKDLILKQSDIYFQLNQTTGEPKKSQDSRAVGEIEFTVKV